MGLERKGFEPEWRTSAPEALHLLGNREFDTVLTDLNMEQMSGLDLCERVVNAQPDVPVIVITAFGSLETAVGAIRAGAYDFVTKPFEMDELVLTAERAVKHRGLKREVKRLRQQLADSQPVAEMLGDSPSMRQLYQVIRRVAPTSATVLVSGESGTGKELIARAIHDMSERKEGPFVAINCAAMPANLLESELFGHVRGAFTDAKQSRAGLLVQATGGTLFLDEIAEMPQEMQAKLLRVLQERRVRPVGGNQEQSFDARIVAATNRDLEGEVEEGRFREDLYYRINVVTIDVPPLKARGRDTLLLAHEFVQRFAARDQKEVRGISAAAAEKLLNYDWPGNVRELQNCMERAVALTQYEQLVVEDLPERVREYKADTFTLPTQNPEELLPIDEVERRYIMKVLNAVSGNKTAAARVLGIDRRTLYRKLERFQLGTA